jgi:hypothetical protein
MHVFATMRCSAYQNLLMAAFVNFYADCRNDKSFFAIAAVGGAVLLGALYLVLNAQTQL